MTHTKGPWKVERSEIHDSEVVYINTDSGTWKQGEVCVLYGALDTNLANARLIAAAPDLLEVLEECVALIRNTITTADDLHEIHNADKAIQKAKA